jgi:[amino group carrier protein]-L-2-aminoadipate 6-kinase
VTTRPLIVVKCGGNRSVDAAGICADVARLVREGQSVLLVHGASGEIARLAGELGVPQRTLVAPDKVSTRYTDPATLEVVILALAGEVKRRILAAALAVALGADQLVLLTGAPGVLADPDDTSVLSTYEVPATGARGRFAGGGIALKPVAAREALAGGVASVCIADGRVPNPVSRALAGSGTTITMTCAGSATNSLRESANQT